MMYVASAFIADGLPRPQLMRALQSLRSSESRIPRSEMGGQCFYSAIRIPNSEIVIAPRRRSI